MYDLRAYGLGGVVPLGWPKFTGGWSVSTPAVGDLDGDGRVEVALMTREGNLFVWHTSGRPCAGQEWPTYQHDNAHTGDYGRDATPPSAVGALAGTAGKGSAVVRWTAPGGDRHCGTAASYRVVVDGTAVMAGVPAPSAAGAAQSVTLALTKGKHTISVQAVDAAGNAGFPRSVTVKAG
jgi:hypothetical protein